MTAPAPALSPADAARLAEIRETLEDLAEASRGQTLPVRLCWELLRLLDARPSGDSFVTRATYEELRDQDVMLEQERDCFKASAEAAEARVAELEREMLAERADARAEVVELKERFRVEVIQHITTMDIGLTLEAERDRLSAAVARAMEE